MTLIIKCFLTKECIITLSGNWRRCSVWKSQGAPCLVWTITPSLKPIRSCSLPMLMAKQIWPSVTLHAVVTWSVIRRNRLWVLPSASMGAFQIKLLWRSPLLQTNIWPPPTTDTLGVMPTKFSEEHLLFHFCFKNAKISRVAEVVLPVIQWEHPLQVTVRQMDEMLGWVVQTPHIFFKNSVHPPSLDTWKLH